VSCSCLHGQLLAALTLTRSVTISATTMNSRKNANSAPSSSAYLDSAHSSSAYLDSTGSDSTGSDSTRPNAESQLSPPSRKVVGLAIAYSAFFLIILWAAYNNRLPLEWLSQFPNYDKAGHVVLYCIPAYLGHRLLRRKHVRFLAQQLPLFPALFTLFTLTEELVQGFSPYRTLDIGDMFCSLAGIAMGYWLANRSHV